MRGGAAGIIRFEGGFCVVSSWGAGSGDGPEFAAVIKVFILMRWEWTSASVNFLL